MKIRSLLPAALLLALGLGVFACDSLRNGGDDVCGCDDEDDDDVEDEGDTEVGDQDDDDTNTCTHSYSDN